MRKFHLSILSFLLVGGLASCNKAEVAPTDESILQTNKDDILSYASSKGLMGSPTSTGVYYALTKPGSSSVAPENGHEIEFSYKLYALSRAAGASVVTDKFIDSSYATKSAYTTVVATNPGLTEGLLKMHEGDQAAILLPSLYAFGTKGSDDGKVSPNTPVRLDVTLKRTRSEDQQINEYLTANKLTPTEVTISGLRFIKTLANSSGVAPTPTQTLTIKYRGQLLRSVSAFDSTGAGTYSGLVTQFVPGFSEGLSKLKVGEKATIVFPSKIGYGATGYQVIPPYAPMRFDIELVSAQ